MQTSKAQWPSPRSTSDGILSLVVHASGSGFHGDSVFLGVVATAGAAGASALALVAWLAIYKHVNAPINRALTAAAQAGRVPADARALQTRWDSVIVARAVLQGIAVAALCAVLALP